MEKSNGDLACGSAAGETHGNSWRFAEFWLQYGDTKGTLPASGRVIGLSITTDPTAGSCWSPMALGSVSDMVLKDDDEVSMPTSAMAKAPSEHGIPEISLESPPVGHARLGSLRQRSQHCRWLKCQGVQVGFISPFQIDLQCVPSMWKHRQHSDDAALDQTQLIVPQYANDESSPLFANGVVDQNEMSNRVAREISAECRPPAHV